MASGASGVTEMSGEGQNDGGGTNQEPTNLTGPDNGETPSGSNTGKDSLKPSAARGARSTTLANVTAPGESVVDEAKVCQFFKMRKCHFGQRCRLSHSEPSPDESGAACPDMDDTQEEEKMEKNKKKGSMNKASKQKNAEGKGEMNKKPRMRTADDVISRILWDPSVDGSEFVVGYVDRFLGVLERPFSDFNWDTNPCDCDYSVELALPRHRIQYFTYRGQRIWDRHTRTDRVFGSTGQSLAPPFGGEEEVKEQNIEQQQDHAKVMELEAPGGSMQEEDETDVCTHTEDTHLEEEKQHVMNIHAPDSILPAPVCKGNGSQEHQESQGACVVEEAANSPQVSANPSPSFQKNELGEEEEKEVLAEWEESWESKDDAETQIGSLQISQDPSVPLEQREKRGGRPPKKQPTHFITFRANTPAILSCFQQLQEELISILPSSSPHWHTASSLHITLCLLVLHGPEEVAAAGEILRQFAHLDRNPPVAVTFPVKLKHFNGTVLYLSPHPQLHLQQLNSGLQEAFRKEGWLHRDSYNPRYHLTLAKVRGTDRERIFEGVGDLKVGKGLNFGRLPVNTLHLCAVGGSKVDDFFEIVCTVTLR
ncbi:leukocyte receptor cluster member 9 isoform 2-T2 [Pholidichthys leucotaenia]